MRAVIGIAILLFIANCNTKSVNHKRQNPKHNNPYLGDTSIHFLHQYKHLVSDSSTFKPLACGLYINQFGDIAFKSFAAGDTYFPEVGHTNTSVFLTTVCGANSNDTIGNFEAKMNTIVDTATFVKLGYEYFKDKNHIYHLFPMSDGGYFRLVKNVDYKTFKCFDSTLYAKDKYKCYYRNKVIEGADTKTFKVLDSIDYANIAFDKKYFYKGENRLEVSEVKEMGLDSIRKAQHGY